MNALQQTKTQAAEKNGRERMKYRLADAMKQCMAKLPVEKITVKEIVEECGTTRQTFYRNFKDKYDLINWYFDKILQESFEHMGEGRTVYEGLGKIKATPEQMAESLVDAMPAELKELLQKLELL